MKVKWILQKLLQRLFLARHPFVSIGRYTYGVPVVLFGERAGARLTIGAFCSLPYRRVTFLLGGEHRHDCVSTFPFDQDFPELVTNPGSRSKGNIVVGNDVWFGLDAMIFSGVTIGDGAVIAARSVVTKDVPPYAIVAGVPARIVKYRFSAEHIKGLLAVKWWEWSDDRLRNEMARLTQPDVDRFLAENSPIQTI